MLESDVNNLLLSILICPLLRKSRCVSERTINNNAFSNSSVKRGELVIEILDLIWSDQITKRIHDHDPQE